MRPEYKYLLIVGFWIALWTFFPLVALFAFIFQVSRHFYLLYRQSRRNKAAEPYRKHDKRWLEMEGFGAQETEMATADPADWWKK